MKIVMVGTGYVGLVSGACLSEFGMHVTCVDKDENKINMLEKGEMPIFEPGLETLVKNNVKDNRLFFSTDCKKAYEDADVIFICVGTPTSDQGDGLADMTYVYAAAEEIAESIKGYTVIVDKSTVPVGTADEVKAIIKKKNPSAAFDVVSNPEFLREGSSIEDFMHPDRIVIGVNSEKAKQVMQDLYHPLSLNKTPLVFTDPKTAEVTKYAANCFLAMKITFINEIADLCEKIGGDVQQVAKGVGLDQRIGEKFLNAGPGYGGSCFPKDILALSKTAQKYQSALRLIETTIDINTTRKTKIIPEKVIEMTGDLKNKTLGILGVTFKPNTDDMREAPSLDIIPALQEKGAKIKAFDPEGMKNAQKLLTDITWCDQAYQAIENTDALVILTEWNEFKSLDLEEIKKRMKSPVIIDLRNIFDPEKVRAAGFEYKSVGRL